MVGVIITVRIRIPASRLAPGGSKRPISGTMAVNPQSPMTTDGTPDNRAIDQR